MLVKVKKQFRAQDECNENILTHLVLHEVISDQKWRANVPDSVCHSQTQGGVVKTRVTNLSCVKRFSRNDRIKLKNRMFGEVQGREMFTK